MEQEDWQHVASTGVPLSWIISHRLLSFAEFTSLRKYNRARNQPVFQCFDDGKTVSAGAVGQSRAMTCPMHKACPTTRTLGTGTGGPRSPTAQLDYLQDQRTDPIETAENKIQGQQQVPSSSSRYRLPTTHDARGGPGQTAAGLACF